MFLRAADTDQNNFFWANTGGAFPATRVRAQRAALADGPVYHPYPDRAASMVFRSLWRAAPTAATRRFAGQDHGPLQVRARGLFCQEERFLAAQAFAMLRAAAGAVSTCVRASSLRSDSAYRCSKLISACRLPLSAACCCSAATSRRICSAYYRAPPCRVSPPRRALHHPQDAAQAYKGAA